MKAADRPALLSKKHFWGACAAEDDDVFCKTAHAVRVSGQDWDRGWQDTYCGASASPEFFRTRAASGKECCPKCLDAMVKSKDKKATEATRKALRASREETYTEFILAQQSAEASVRRRDALKRTLDRLDAQIKSL